MFPPMSSDRVRWLLLAVAAGVLVAHSLTYNFVTDDAYISFVFSRNLAEHGELYPQLAYPLHEEMKQTKAKMEARLAA